MKLDLGSGNSSDKDYVKMDVYPFSNADVIHDMEKIPYPFQSESFDVIRSHHSLEHCSFPRVQEILSECFRLLKPNGYLKIEVPCLESAIKAFLTLPEEKRWNSVAMEYIFGNQNKTQLGNQQHKSGFTIRILQDLVEAAGFKVENQYKEVNNIGFEVIKLEAKKHG